MSVQGIHHITAISSNPRQTYDFYTRVLGLRLVKKSVNQDDVRTYHLFFGDSLGEPGMDLTFFTFQPAQQGRHDAGQVGVISLAIPASSMEFWEKRLQGNETVVGERTVRFGYERLEFSDADGQQYEFVGVPADELDRLAHPQDIWTAEVSAEHAIRCFWSARLDVVEKDQIAPVLEVLGYSLIAEQGSTQLWQVPMEGELSSRAKYMELEITPRSGRGLNAAGTVHHIAFEVPDDEALRDFQVRLFDLGLSPTPIIDRYYFHSVYFRTPAGILFELATSGPGFVADESPESLGEELALPPFLEPHRSVIESGLPPLETSE